MSGDSENECNLKSIQLPPEDPSRIEEIGDDFLSDRDHIPIQVLPSLDRNWRYIRTHYKLGKKHEDVYVIRLNWGTEEEILRRTKFRREFCTSFVNKNPPKKEGKHLQNQLEDAEKVKVELASNVLILFFFL